MGYGLKPFLNRGSLKIQPRLKVSTNINCYHLEAVSYLLCNESCVLN